MNEQIPDEIRAMMRSAVAEVRQRQPMEEEEFERLVADFEKTWLRRLSSKTNLNAGTFPDPRAAEREWVCFSTALTEGWLMLACNRTGAQGVVKDPTSDEWGWAFDCPSNPKLWTDNSRVTVMKEGNL